MIEAEDRLIHAAIHHGHFGASYQNLTKILRLLSPGVPILHLLQSQQSSAMGSVHPSGRCRQPALVGNFVAKQPCNRAMVTGRVEHVDRVEQRPTHLWEGLAGHEPYARGTDLLQELPACTPRIRDERHAGSQEATAGEEKHISVRIEVSDHDISSSRTGRKENAMSHQAVHRPGAGPRQSWYGIKTRTLLTVALIVLVSVLHPSSFHGIALHPQEAIAAPTRSTTIALTSDEKHLVVVNREANSVSIIRVKDEHGHDVYAKLDEIGVGEAALRGGHPS